MVESPRLLSSPGSLRTLSLCHGDSVVSQILNFILENIVEFLFVLKHLLDQLNFARNFSFLLISGIDGSWDYVAHLGTLRSHCLLFSLLTVWHARLVESMRVIIKIGLLERLGVELSRSTMRCLLQNHSVFETVGLINLNYDATLVIFDDSTLQVVHDCITLLEFLIAWIFISQWVLIRQLGLMWVN